MLSVEGQCAPFELTNLFPPYIPAMDNDVSTLPTLTSLVRTWAQSCPMWA